MTDSEKILIFEKKLEQLKEEESRILKILKDVRKQLKKYEVEELQICSESVADKGREEKEESDSDESIGNEELLQKLLDCANVVNSSSLNLELKNILQEQSNGESEESDESD